MATEAELIVDRRRMRRKLTVWRVLAILLAVAAIAALAWTPGGFSKYEKHIARIRIDGLITGDQATLDLLDKVAKTSAVQALVIRIDSPGGTTAGSEALYEELRRVAKQKPVVAVMDTVAASGGYITAIAADHIVARGNTITGSIGVIFSFPEISRLLDTLGIKMEEIKSGELKAEPSPYKPVSDKVRAVSNEMVQDSFAWFKGLVAERRKLPAARVDVLADGRVYTGRQAVADKLVDEIGGEDEAVAWLEKERKIAPGLKLVDWANPVGTDPTGLGFAIADRMLQAVGLAGWRDKAERAKLDGLLVLWHPQL
ncbi:MAG: signal peptide peptidase SppA [Rhizobiales bacterium]|nr:signal peptide peptidase SppA [Hyphomicrobiales bacterium]MBI3673370.1 signal peptide peptidase SppA [Hyphomicrobiales bacterium]